MVCWVLFWRGGEDKRCCFYYIFLLYKIVGRVPLKEIVKSLNAPRSGVLMFERVSLVPSMTLYKCMFSCTGHLELNLEHNCNEHCKEHEVLVS